MEDKDEKRLQSIRERMAQLKAQEKSFIARVKEKERKLRTRRLIENGALAEKYLKCENFSPMQFEEKLKRVVKKIKIADSLRDKNSSSDDRKKAEVKNDSVSAESG